MWSTVNGIKLNLIKTQMLRCRTVNGFKKIYILNRTAAEVSFRAQNLGVMFDSHLTFNENVMKKVGSGWWKLRTAWKFRHDTSSELNYRLVKALLFSHTDYCNCIYYSYLSYCMKNNILLLQNAYLRFLYRIERGQQITLHYNRSNILKIVGRVQLHLGVLLYKIINDRELAYLHERLQFRSLCYTVNIHGARPLSTPKHKCEKFKSSFDYAAAKLYNRYRSVS